jgi:hypothetical protein
METRLLKPHTHTYNKTRVFNGVSEDGIASIIRRSREIINSFLLGMPDGYNLFSRRQKSQFVYFVS